MAAGLVDTNTFIDVLRYYPIAVSWLANQSQLGVTRIVYLELLEGAENKIEQQRALKLVKRFELIELTISDFEWATQKLTDYRLSHGVDLVDCLIAVPSYRLKLPLYTRNLKHFTHCWARWRKSRIDVCNSLTPNTQNC